MNLEPLKIPNLKKLKSWYSRQVVHPIPVSSACSDNEHHCFPPDAMLVHCKQETAIQLLKIPQCLSYKSFIN